MLGEEACLLEIRHKKLDIKYQVSDFTFVAQYRALSGIGSNSRRTLILI